MRKTLAVVGSITMLTSCTSYYPVRAGRQLAPASIVTVTFASPRDLEATHDTVVCVLPAVEKVRGELQYPVGDTLLLRVVLVESKQRQPQLPTGARLRVVPDASTRVDVLGTSPGKTAGFLVLALVGALALGFAADPPPE